MVWSVGRTAANGGRPLSFKVGIDRVYLRIQYESTAMLVLSSGSVWFFSEVFSGNASFGVDVEYSVTSC